MAGYRQILKQYVNYIEFGALLVAFISILIPFIKINLFDKTDIAIFGKITISYVKFRSGKWVLFFVIVSTLLVGLNTFARNMVEYMKSTYKHAKTIDAVVELVPLIFISISFLLTIISGITLPTKFRSLTVGFFLLVLSLIVILAARVFYLLKIRKLNKDISIKEIRENIKDSTKPSNKPTENGEEKVEQTTTDDDDVVIEVSYNPTQQTIQATDAAVVGTNKPEEQITDQDIAQINTTNYHKH